jgi:hypothetical protein
VNTIEASTQAIQTNVQTLDEVKTALRDIRLMLGLETSQNARVLSEPVPWSYFHVWIARINERLERLERERP